MKTSKNLLFYCTLLGAVAALSGSQLSLAQEQPRRAENAIDPDAKVVLPAEFSAVQFFDALAQATNARIVAPMPNQKQLAQLNANLGGRALTVKEISSLYQKMLGYDLSNLAPNSNVIVVRLPDEMIYPTYSLDENDAAFLRLLVALSPAQIEQMYLQSGLTVQDLTPAQIPLYLQARHKNPYDTFVLSENKPQTDAQILAQPVRFRFAFQAVALFTDDESLPSLPLFDYGTGLLWNPLVAADTKKWEKIFEEGTMIEPAGAFTKPAVADMAKALNTPLVFAQTQSTTIGAILDKIGRASGQTIAFGQGPDDEKLRAKPIIVSAGDYKTGELTFAVAASAGLEFGFFNGVPTLTKRRPKKPMSQLPPLVEQAQQKLRRLPFQASGLPFYDDRFEDKSVSYKYLSGSEKFYLWAKLLNEQTEGYDAIDPSKHTFRFENQLLLIGQTGDRDRPFVTSTLQLW